MSFFGFGNRTINSVTSTAFTTSNPSSGTLLAEIDINGTNATIPPGGMPWQVSWIVGVQTTLAAFSLEQVSSTGLDLSTSGRDWMTVMCSSGQSAQFITKHNVERGDRFRVRVVSTFTGAAAAKIIAEPLI